MQMYSNTFYIECNTLCGLELLYPIELKSCRKDGKVLIEKQYYLQKFVNVETILEHKELFFELPEVPGVEVYVGDIRGDIAMIISRNLVDPKQFPKAIEVELATEVRIKGWD